MLSRRKFLAAAAGAAACAGAYAFGVEPVWLRTVELEVPLARLDPAFDGFRIVQLSDLHVGAGVPLDYLADAVGVANGARPDLVALTGDHVHEGGSRHDVHDLEAILGDLDAPAVAVFGNHDGSVYARRQTVDRAGLDRVRNGLQRAGVQPLVNERVTLRRGDARLHVTGLGDLWLDAFQPQAVPLCDAAAPTVALSHNPDTAPALAGHGADLVLCGHTHGGQVAVPFLGPPILPVRHREFAAGRFDLGATQLYVNRGIGWLRRVRLFVRPEVTVFTLRPSA